jgi:hypothetical protein
MVVIVPSSRYNADSWSPVEMIDMYMTGGGGGKIEGYRCERAKVPVALQGLVFENETEDVFVMFIHPRHPRPQVV